MEVTRLRQVAQGVEDLPRAIAFYRDVLGMRLIASFDPPGLAFFDLGSTRLLLARGAPSSLLYIEVPDNEAAWTELVAAGVTAEDPPHLIFPDPAGTFGPAGGSEWMAFFRDSEGNLIALAERRSG